MLTPGALLELAGAPTGSTPQKGDTRRLLMELLADRPSAHSRVVQIGEGLVDPVVDLGRALRQEPRVTANGTPVIRAGLVGLPWTSDRTSCVDRRCQVEALAKFLGKLKDESGYPPFHTVVLPGSAQMDQLLEEGEPVDRVFDPMHLYLAAGNALSASGLSEQESMGADVELAKDIMLSSIRPSDASIQASPTDVFQHLITEKKTSTSWIKSLAEMATQFKKAGMSVRVAGWDAHKLYYATLLPRIVRTTLAAYAASGDLVILNPDNPAEKITFDELMTRNWKCAGGRSLESIYAAALKENTSAAAKQVLKFTREKLVQDFGDSSNLLLVADSNDEFQRELFNLSTGANPTKAAIIKPLKPTIKL